MVFKMGINAVSMGISMDVHCTLILASFFKDTLEIRVSNQSLTPM